MKVDEPTWQNFRGFSQDYQRIRVAFIETARNRPEEFTKRLNHLVRLTAKNKMFGYVRELTDKP